MIGNWEQSFEYVLESEGGFAKLDGDSGGTTNLGVTQKVWEHWVGHPVTEDDMKALTVDDVKPLYKKEFWDAVQADVLPVAIDYMCFD
jgi:lysozyme family protein